MPLECGSEKDLFCRVAVLRKKRIPAALVTLVATKGSTPRKSGSKAIMHADGRIEGSVGGGRVEFVVQKRALKVIASGLPELIEHQLTTELGMCCGGRMTFFVEPLIMNPTLIILGCGHIGQALARTAQAIGFDIVACDERDNFAGPKNFPEGCVLYDAFDALDVLPWGTHTYVVICTHDHALDQKLLEECMRKPHAYMGVIGSERKAAQQRKRLELKGFDSKSIGNIKCPVGVQLGGQTPEEIAISICAELIEYRYAARHSA